MDFTSKMRKIDDIDLPRIGHQIGVGEDEIHAVIDVESRGSGMDSQGRPIILFERLWFYRLLPKRLKQRALDEGLASTSWSRATYNDDQYELLSRAMRIDKEAALKSCSWGMFQIMGFNHKSAGYDNVFQMIEHFKLDEENHLQAMVNFVINEGLDDELRDHDWRGFARGYNGSGYAKNKYHTKLANAFRKWSRIPDTPWNPNEVANLPPEAEKVIVDAAAENRTSKTALKAATVGVAGTATVAKQGLDIVSDITSKVDDVKTTVEGAKDTGTGVLDMLGIDPMFADKILPIALGIALIVLGVMFVLERRRKRNLGKAALAAIQPVQSRYPDEDEVMEPVHPAVAKLNDDRKEVMRLADLWKRM